MSKRLTKMQSIIEIHIKVLEKLIDRIEDLEEVDKKQDCDEDIKGYS